MPEEGMMELARHVGKLCAIAVVLVLLGAPAGATVIYSLDDGSGELGVGCSGACNVSLIWGNHFLRAAGGESIVAVSAAFGSSADHAAAMNGTPVVASVWSDPDGDGDPSDAVLLTSTAGFVANWATDVFNTFDVPDVLVGPSFFAAFSLVDPGGVFPGRFDGSTPGIHSWVGGGTSLTGASINNASVEWGTYLIRAEGEPVPEPGTMLILVSGLAGMAVRRRRAS
jgi:hypothetical protein